MPRIGVRVIRSPERQRLARKGQAVAQEIRDSLHGEIANLAIWMAREIVDSWEHKPEFETRVTITSNEIRMYMYPTGDNAKYWTWTSRGTKPHPIDAKNAPYPVFRGQYNPKTWKGGIWGGPGVATGLWSKKKHVDHPGTEPREFEEWIMNEIKADFRREIENAFNRGAS